MHTHTHAFGRILVRVYDCVYDSPWKLLCRLTDENLLNSMLQCFDSNAVLSFLSEITHICIYEYTHTHTYIHTYSAQCERKMGVAAEAFPAVHMIFIVVYYCLKFYCHTFLNLVTICLHGQLKKNLFIYYCLLRVTLWQFLGISSRTIETFLRNSLLTILYLQSKGGFKCDYFYIQIKCIFRMRVRLLPDVHSREA